MASQRVDRWARLGDLIETTVEHPRPARLRVRLATRESAAYANELIAAGRWRLIARGWGPA